MRLRGQRLGDTPPYFIPHGDSALLFLCRFSTETPISVSLPGSASPFERQAIMVALDGWSKAVPGIRFEEVSEGAAMITIRFTSRTLDPSEGHEQIAGMGYTVSDCALESGWQEGVESGGPVAAQLARASIYMSRSNRDEIGQEIPLTVDQLIGAMLHEMGHALGFPGHVSTLNSVMTRTTDTVVRFGRRLRRDGEFSAPSLAALYALRSGTRVGSAEIAAGQRALFRSATTWAQRRNLQGPFVRVGEYSANLNWRDRGVVVGSLEIRRYLDSLHRGRPLFFSKSPLRRTLQTR